MCPKWKNFAWKQIFFPNFLKIQIFIFQHLTYHFFNCSVISPSKIEPYLTVFLWFLSIFWFSASLINSLFRCRNPHSAGVTYSLMKKSMALAIGKCPIGLPIFYVLIIHSIFSGFALDEKLHRNDSLPYFWNTYVSHPTFTRASKNWHLRNVNIRQANRNFFFKLKILWKILN